jgi:hypothetical protein
MQSTLNGSRSACWAPAVAAAQAGGAWQAA